VDPEPVEHRQDVVGRVLVAVEVGRLRHLRRRIAPRIEGDAPVLAREPADLLLPLAQVGAELVDEDDRAATAVLLVVEPGTLRRDVWHGLLQAVSLCLVNWHATFHNWHTRNIGAYNAA